MPITPQEAQQLLQQAGNSAQPSQTANPLQAQPPASGYGGMPPAQNSAGGISPQEAQQLLLQPRVGAQQVSAQGQIPGIGQQPDKDQPEESDPHSMLLDMYKKPVAEFATGTIQGLSNMGYSLAQLGDKGINYLVKKLTGKNINLVPPKGDIFSYGHYEGKPLEELRQTPIARFGEHVAGPSIGAIAGGEALGAGGGILSKMLKYGASAGALTPGGLKKRAWAAGLGAGGGFLEKAMMGLPYIFRGRLASKLENVRNLQKSISNDLYHETFAKTEKIPVNFSDETNESLKHLKNTWLSQANPATRALKVFEKNKNIEGIHTLRSDLNKIRYKLKSKGDISGLTGQDISIDDALKDTNRKLNSELEKHMQLAGPDKHSMYQVAQKHYKDRVIPFKQYPSLRKLFGKDRDVTTRLYTDLSKDAIGAKKLRGLLKTDLATVQVARILHNKYLGLSLPAVLSLGGGYHLYHHDNLKKSIGEP